MIASPEALRILDTDHISLHQRGHSGVVARIASLPAGSVAVTVVSLEESMRGWLAVVRRAQDVEALQRAYGYLHAGWAYYRMRPVLPFTAPAVQEYLRLRQVTSQVGTQDLKIAAIALAQGAVLATRNRRDFQHILGLVTEDWTVEPADG